MPYSRSLTRPASDIHSVVHAGDSTTRTRDVGVALVSHAALDVLADGVERRASRIRRRDVDIDVAGRVDADVAKDAEIRDGQGGHLRVGDRAGHAADLVDGGHQVTPGERPMEVLHLSEHVPKWLGMQSQASPRSASRCSPGRPTSRRRGRGRHTPSHSGRSDCRVGADAQGRRPRASRRRSRRAQR